MKILVTGATGFIGRHLVSALRGSGHDVVAAIRESVDGGSMSVGDIGPSTDWASALDGADAVVHLAAIAHVISGRLPTESDYQRVNVAGTRSLAAAAAAAGVGRFVFMSSIGAVASQSAVPVTELTTPAPDTPYGRSKLEAERAIASVLTGSGTSWAVLRPPLVYGPGNPGNMARLIEFVHRGLPLPVGGIANRRSLVYVGNLVDAVTAMLSDTTGSGVWNVADAEVVSTAGLARLVADALGKPASVWSVPRGVLSVAAVAGDGLGRLTGRRFPIDSRSLGGMIGSLEVDTSKIGSFWSPAVSTAEGIHRSFSVD